MKKEGRRRARVCVYVIVFAHARVVRERIIRLIYQKKKKKQKKTKKKKKISPTKRLNRESDI